MSRGERLLQQVFLLEVVLDDIILPTDVCICKDIDKATLKAHVKFFDFPCFELKSCGYGKSRLFAMPPLDLAHHLDNYPLNVTITGPGEHIVGATEIELGPSMSSTVRSSAYCTQTLPTSVVLKDTFPLRPTGKVDLFIRMSCFGPAVVTQFQLTGKQKGQCLFRSSTLDTASICPGVQKPTSDFLPVAPLICSDTGDVTVRDTPPDPSAIVDQCDCDLYRKLFEPQAEPEQEIPKFPLFQAEAPPVAHPRVRYDTTGALSPAAQNPLPPPTFSQHPPVRYDTTGALSPAFQGIIIPPKWPQHPPVRYDTTGALSPAALGLGPPPGLAPQIPMVRYDTTSALSPAFQFPPVMYNTTGALSAAYMGTFIPPEPGVLVPTLSTVQEVHEEEKVVAASSVEELDVVQTPAEVEPVVPEDTPESPTDKTEVSAPVSTDVSGGAGSKKRKKKPPPKLCFTPAPQPVKEVSPAAPAPAAPAPAAPASAAPASAASSEELAKEYQVPDEPPVQLEEGIDVENTTAMLRQITSKQKQKKAVKERPVALRGQLGIVRYPTMHNGHRLCIDERPHVPKRMGWLWNEGEFKPRPGWRPGAVMNSVNKLIKRYGKVTEEAPPPPHNQRRPRPHAGKDADAHTYHEFPTMELVRHDGEYSVRMRPVGHGEAKPLEFHVPEPSSPSSYTVSTETSSGFEIQFLAPAAFPPVLRPKSYFTRGIQCEDLPVPKAEEPKDTGKGKGKGKKGKK